MSWALAVIASASVATAQEARRPPEALPLGDAERVRALCLSLRPADRVVFAGDPEAQQSARSAHDAARGEALERRYRTRIQPGAFRFSEYRDSDGRLVLDLSKPVRTLSGNVVLLSSVSEVGFAMSPAAAGAVPASAMLDLTFTLDARDGGVCTGSAGADLFRLRITPLTIDLLDRAGVALSHAEVSPGR